MSRPTAPGRGIVHSALRPLCGPYIWYDTKSWAGRVDPFVGAGGELYGQGVIANQGSAGSLYDLPVRIGYDTGEPSYVYEAYMYRYNWPSPDTNPAVSDPADQFGNPDADHFGYMPPTFFDDIGGLLVEGGPLCFCALRTDPIPAGYLSNQDELVFITFDFTNGWAQYFQAINDEEMFTEWFDYVNVSISDNFTETRGPYDGAGYDRADLNGRLQTLWQDSGSGVSDILLDRTSLWADPTDGGNAPGQTRGDMFYKWYVAETDPGFDAISTLNDPDSIYTNFVDTDSLPHEVDIQFGQVTRSSEMPIGDPWPGIEAFAVFRGVPTAIQLDEIKAAMVAGLAPPEYDCNFGPAPDPDPDPVFETIETQAIASPDQDDHMLVAFYYADQAGGDFSLITETWDMSIDPTEPTVVATKAHPTVGVPAFTGPFDVASPSLVIPRFSRAANGSDHEIRIWDLSDPSDPTPYAATPLAANRVGGTFLSPDGTKIAVLGSGDNLTTDVQQVYFYDATDPDDVTFAGQVRALVTTFASGPRYSELLDGCWPDSDTFVVVDYRSGGLVSIDASNVSSPGVSGSQYGGFGMDVVQAVAFLDGRLVVGGYDTGSGLPKKFETASFPGLVPSGSPVTLALGGTDVQSSPLPIGDTHVGFVHDTNGRQYTILSSGVTPTVYEIAASVAGSTRIRSYWSTFLVSGTRYVIAPRTFAAPWGVDIQALPIV